MEKETPLICLLATDIEDTNFQKKKDVKIMVKATMGITQLY